MPNFNMRPKIANKKTHTQARHLRRHMTESETKLWSRLRNHRMNDIHFRRQYSIGKYIVDFCAPYHKLIIEIDGSQHLDRLEDVEPSKYLTSKGYKILRFWNHEVLNELEGVLNAIFLAINNDGEKA